MYLSGEVRETVIVPGASATEMRSGSPGSPREPDGGREFARSVARCQGAGTLS
jgi:hypothetical protein